MKNMDEAIRQIHNTAMDLSELAKLKRSREGEKAYQDYLQAAFELELYAGTRVEFEAKEDKNGLVYLKDIRWAA